jgi:hypothetical protein
MAAEEATGVPPPATPTCQVCLTFPIARLLQSLSADVAGDNGPTAL